MGGRRLAVDPHDFKPCRVNRRRCRGFCAAGPELGAGTKFDPGLVLTAWRVKSLRLANFGYLGHMWELYAMWAWIGVFMQTSFSLRLIPGIAEPAAAYATFAVIAVGALDAWPAAPSPTGSAAPR